MPLTKAELKAYVDQHVPSGSPVSGSGLWQALNKIIDESLLKQDAMYFAPLYPPGSTSLVLDASWAFRRVIVTSATYGIVIPDTVQAGFICEIFLESETNHTIQISAQTNAVLQFAGGATYNKLKIPYSVVEIFYAGGGVYHVLGANLE